MKKDQALTLWRRLPAGQDPLPTFRPIPYKTAGSKYGCCGIRIDGTAEFIDAVLSNLKALLAGENSVTRLELSRRPVERQAGWKAGENAEKAAEVCYIRLHVRGHEGSMLQAFCGGPTIAAASRQYAAALGVGQ